MNNEKREGKSVVETSSKDVNITGKGASSKKAKLPLNARVKRAKKSFSSWTRTYKKKIGSVGIILAFIALVTFGTYTVVFGLGKLHAGKAANIKLGLDLNGGVSITYDIVADNPTDTEIKDTIAKIQKRVEPYSTEAEVYKEGKDRISVEIPGVSDSTAILEELGKPGSLSFVDESGNELLTGSDVKNANAKITSNSTTGGNEYVVELQFTDEGTQKFAQATADNLGKIIYIFYDGEVVSQPKVNTTITDGNAIIEGMSSYEEADRIATTIRIGALPLELKELRSNVVGAKLGQDAIDTSLKAGVIGLAIVCILMIVIYLFPGFVSSLALVAYVVLMLLCLNGFNVTLTLPGIAGIILSIGMAVDANVIIFTRIKEELSEDKSVHAAIKAGFDKSLSAILDGNITTLIAAAVLWWRGTGSIKGFAQTLAIGIVLSMFTALVITKLLINAFFELGIRDKKFYGKKRTAKVFNYVKASKYCAVLSLVVIALGFIFLPINKKQIGNILNYSLEFKGGTTITATYEKEYTASEAEDEVVPIIAQACGINAGEIQVQPVKDSTQLVIKTSQLSVDQRESVQNALEEKFNVTEFATENISSTISSEMRTNAIISVIIATICMLIYIIFRFKDARFGASAVLALVHDVLVVFTVYSVARLSVGNTFIACMLTIVGYSINATIIIFDRVRENLNEMNIKKVGLDTVVNTSISQTFTRTIYTSLTTFVMVFVLWIMGVASIKTFAVTLMAGIICGAYSSVCITAPLWYFLRTRIKKTATK